MSSLIPEIEQGREIGVGLEDNIAAFASIAAPRTAVRNKLFFTEGYGSVASVAGLHLYGYFVYKYHAFSYNPVQADACKKYVL
jgi:hypothetical protein